jgi:hypothetical protein
MPIVKETFCRSTPNEEDIEGNPVARIGARAAARKLLIPTV